MSEPTEQIAERDRNNALMITNLQAEVDRLTIDRDAWRLTARTFERASAMSEPTEQQYIEAAAEEMCAALIRDEAEYDSRGSIKLGSWTISMDKRRQAAAMIKRLAAAPRQASAMSAEADRIHVRLLAMGWLDHREDNCKTATEAAKLIRELSEESAPRQAEGWQPGDRRCVECDSGLEPEWFYCPFCAKLGGRLSGDGETPDQERKP